MKMKEKIESLWMEYNAIMANAYPGDEEAIMAEIVALGGENYQEEFLQDE